MRSSSNRNLRKASLVSLIVLCMTGVFYTGSASAQLAHLLDLVYPPKSYPALKSFPALAAGYWKWLLPISGANSPWSDTTGAHCGENQSGFVWYLANSAPTLSGPTSTGPSSIPVTRSCTVPVGRTIVFPVIGRVIVAAPGTMAPYNTESYLRQQVKFDPASVLELAVTLDGVAVPNPIRYYEDSDLFSFTIRPGSTSDLAPGFYSAGVDANFFFAVQPLLPGHHTLHFRGVLDVGEGFTSTVDVTYNLTVSLF
ncbi:MAG: putative signal peptide protein [Myxococcaceae bacterium]|nr:putative signal peptide protein [Myxococcaceae bacterium]